MQSPRPFLGSWISGSPAKGRIEFVLKGLLIATVTIVAHTLLMSQASPLREPVQTIEYAFLQKLLILGYNLTGRNTDESAPEADHLPVIIDISEYSDPSCPTMPTRGVTDINCLDLVVQDVVKYRPRAIGIDVDLSPNNDGWPTQKNDWKVFERWQRESGYDQHCVGAKNAVPIKVGVFRRRYDAPPNWLGPPFRCLAAGILIPRDHQMNFYDYAPIKPELTGDDHRLLMAAALHEVAGGRKPSRKFPVLRTMEDASMSPDWNYSAYVIDYSYRRDITSDRVFPWRGKSSLATVESKIQGNVVLIGDKNGAHDSFQTPDMPNGDVAGVVIHACSLVTLDNNPLGYVDDSLGLVLDILLTAGSMALVLLGSEIAQKRHLEYHRYHLVERRYRMALSGTISVLYLFLIAWTRIFWPGIFWVAPVLFLDTYVSDPFWGFAARLWTGAAAWLTKGYQDVPE
jgi:hypothetical protein